MNPIWKKALAIALAVVLIGGASPAANWLAVTAAAESVSGTCGADGDNVTWSLDTVTGEMTISGTGDMADYEDEDETPWADYRDSIQTVVIDSGVTSIGGFSFAGCQSLTEVAIGTDVTRIGMGAFAFSTLTSIFIPDSVQEIDMLALVCFTFSEEGEIIPTMQQIDVDAENAVYSSQDGVLYDKTNTMLLQYPIGNPQTAFSVPDGVTAIGAMAFFYSMILEHVTIPGDVTEIGEEAFSECTNLRSVTMTEGLTEIGEGAFRSCEGLESITIPDSVTQIGEDAFYDCTGMATLKIGSGIERIDDNVFYRCATLTNLTIPDNVTEIGRGAFSSCESLESVTIGSGVTTIDDFAFDGCSGLTDIHIPSGVTQIGSGAFANCSNLAFICCDTIDSAAKTYADANGIEFRLCSGHESSQNTVSGECGIAGNNVMWMLDLDTGEMTISGAGDMANYKYVWSYDPDNSSFHPDTPWDTYRAFIHTVTVGDGVTTIGNNAFRECENLTGVTLGNGLARIGVWSFGECEALTDLEIPAGVTIIDDGAFALCKSVASVTIPEGVTTVGNNAFWRTALSSVSIPSSVQEIGTSAFVCCLVSDEEGLAPTLQQIFVDSKNKAFSSQDGVLYNKSKNILIQYPCAKEDAVFVIPNSVTTISASAFYGSKNLKSVTIPDSVTTIGESAFEGCSGLTSIHIPSGVATIGEDVFKDCDDLVCICSEFAGCYAETYAEENNIAFRYCLGHDGQNRVAGDADGDGTVTLKDAVLMRRYLAGGWNVTVYGACADVDADNEVTLMDVTLICRYLAGGWNAVLV